jgi:hypothetical protein
MKMPKPHLQGGSFASESGFQGSADGFTEAQMKQYGRDLLEEAAKECDNEQATYEERYKTCTDTESRGECVGRIQMAYERAQAIRAMKETL